MIIRLQSKTSEWISSCARFVANLTNHKFQLIDPVVCPFQFDAVLAFKEFKEVYHSDNDDENDDDGNDNKNEEVENGNEEWKIVETGYVKHNLHKEKLIFTEVPPSTDNASHRMIHGCESFVAHARKTCDKYSKDYPRMHRFNAFIGRNKQINKHDDLIFFDSPNDCNQFRNKQHQSLSYFDRSKTCIIPQIGYKDNGRDIKETITSASMNNGTIILSFHVESAEEIRYYLSINGECIRFMPEDIKDLLPVFFDQSYGDNAKFAKGRAESLVKLMKKTPKDDKFSKFEEKYGKN